MQAPLWTDDCYTDLPDLGGLTSRGKCFHVSPATSDEWCDGNCNTPGGECDPNFCRCEGDDERQDVFNVSAPIQGHDTSASPDSLPKESDDLVKKVKKAEQEHPSGLPECTWRPPKGCSKKAQYQCMEGKKQGQCSGENWFGRDEECEHSCVHTSLLPTAPYSALWYPGPLAREFQPGESQPRYNHTARKMSLANRGVDLSKSDVMLSATCKSKANQFVGVALYSPKYEAKAKRLLRSCSRVGVCCKATFLPPDAFGKDAPEGPMRDANQNPNPNPSPNPNPNPNPNPYPYPYPYPNPNPGAASARELTIPLTLPLPLPLPLTLTAWSSGSPPARRRSSRPGSDRRSGWPRRAPCKGKGKGKG